MNTEKMITELNAVAEKHKNDFVPTFQTNITAMCRDIIPKLKQLSEYETIGTVEECREARERQRGKKPVKYGDTRQGLDNGGNSISWQEDCYECPTCGSFLGYAIDCEDEQYQEGYCRNCGQAILREEE